MKFLIFGGYAMLATIDNGRGAVTIDGMALTKPGIKIFIQRWHSPMRAALARPARDQEGWLSPRALVDFGNQENDARQVSGRKLSILLRGGAI